jgi:molybdopterin/thiamine biosynthesis adenylyltransferase/rhodanese-related sulfurtransferase
VPLSPAEQERYSRHTLLPEFGVEGQERLKAGRVLIVGAGGLGSPAALYLAAAGVGTIGLVDFDDVDLTNLQRQVLYGTSDVGRPKVDVASAKLSDLNPHITIARHRERLTASNASQIIQAYDLVVDGTDNFSTRYLVNDVCVMARRPNVYGSVFRFEGQAAVFAAADGPCYRCLHPEPPPPGLIPNCAEAGVLGVLPGIIGTIQATEAIKLLTGIGEPLVGKLLLYDALRMRFRQITLPRDPSCPVCGDAPSITTLTELDLTCEPAGADGQEQEMTVEELRQWRDERRPHLLIDVREPGEHAASRIEGAQLIPLRQLQSHVKSLPKGQPIVVHCQSGGRSAVAVALLKVQGFDARNLSGGIKAWQKAEKSSA